jgi:signal peptidase II
VEQNEIAKWAIFLSVSVALIALDQFTKVLVLEHIRLGQTISVIPGFLNWTYVSNPGAAFGFLSQMPQDFREHFFLIVPPMAAVFVFSLVKATQLREMGQLIALSCILGGAMGNFIDRIRFRFVIDFIDIYFGDSLSWPAFNLADVAIVLGALSLVYYVIREAKSKTYDQEGKE